MATYGLPRQVAPDVALLEEVHRTAGHVAWLGERVAELEAGEVTWGVVEETDKPPGVESLGGTEVKRKAAPHALVVLYQAERKHLADVCKAALAAGVSERLVNVFEQVGQTYVRLLERVLDQLDLDEGQRRRVPEVVQAELAAIAGGDAA